MNCRHNDVGVHGLSEGGLEEAQIGPPEYASIVRVELDVDNFLVVGARYGDCSGEPDFDWCVDGGEHCVCLGVSQGDDKAGELRGGVFA